MHMYFQQEAYDAEYAAIARALETAALLPLAHKRITIHTDAQAVVQRMGSDEPGPGQRYAALGARRHIATIRRRRPEVTIELRWRPAQEGGTYQGMRRRTNGQSWQHTEPDAYCEARLQLVERRSEPLTGVCSAWVRLLARVPESDAPVFLPANLDTAYAFASCHLASVIERFIRASDLGGLPSALWGSPHRAGRRFSTASLANNSDGRRSSPPPSAGGALTGPRHGSTSSSAARTGNASRKSCGQRCEERQGDVETGSRSGASSPTSAAAS